MSDDVQDDCSRCAGVPADLAAPALPAAPVAPTAPVTPATAPQRAPRNSMELEVRTVPQAQFPGAPAVLAVPAAPAAPAIAPQQAIQMNLQALFPGASGVPVGPAAPAAPAAPAIAPQQAPIGFRMSRRDLLAFVLRAPALPVAPAAPAALAIALQQEFQMNRQALFPGAFGVPFGPAAPVAPATALQQAFQMNQQALYPGAFDVPFGTAAPTAPATAPQQTPDRIQMPPPSDMEPLQPKKCSNCGTDETKIWRTSLLTGAKLCNACGLHEKLHHDNRPRNDMEREERSTGNQRITDGNCINCGPSKSTYWRKRKLCGGTLCNACWLYEKQNSVPRPVGMKKEYIKRRFRRPTNTTPNENEAPTADVVRNTTEQSNAPGPIAMRNDRNYHGYRRPTNTTPNENEAPPPVVRNTTNSDELLARANKHIKALEALCSKIGAPRPLAMRNDQIQHRHPTNNDNVNLVERMEQLNAPRPMAMRNDHYQRLYRRPTYTTPNENEAPPSVVRNFTNNDGLVARMVGQSDNAPRPMAMRNDQIQRRHPTNNENVNFVERMEQLNAPGPIAMRNDRNHHRYRHPTNTTPNENEAPPSVVRNTTNSNELRAKTEEQIEALKARYQI